MRKILWAFALAVVGAALLLPAQPAAAAQRCHQEAVKNPDGSISYKLVCVDVTPGTPGTPGGGEAEDCGQDEANLPYEGAPFCYNGIPCQYTDNIVPLAPPAEPAPEGQKWQARYCTNGTKVLVLTGGNEPRPLLVQAQEAFGELDAPVGQVGHSPGPRGLVQLPTWLWLQPGSFTVEPGSSAEGLQAIAVPAGSTWDTGDGATLNCPGGGTPDSPACSHTYTRASERYDGNVRRTWTVRYEQGGAVIAIPGAPGTLVADTPWFLQVAEAQVVTGDRPGG